MLKMTRSAALAAVLLIAVAGAVVPPVAMAQAQPAAPAVPAAPAAEPAPAAVAANAASGARSTEVVDNP